MADRVIYTLAMNFLKNHKATLFRICLLLILVSFSYIVTRESYNFAHFLPNKLLRNVGVSYDKILWFEQNADVVLHLLGGFLITLLLILSDLPILRCGRWIPVVLVCCMCVLAEVFQDLIGRGKETSDLLLGICGSFMAYLATNRKK